MKKITVVLFTLMLMILLFSCKVRKADTSTLNVCIASEPDTIDPALNKALDGATYIIHLFQGLAKWNKKPDGTLTILPDAAEELPHGSKNTDGTYTFIYKLRDGLTWSDGKPVSAKDYEFAWKRAAGEDLGSDYGYMFEIIVGYPNNLAVKATDNKTLVVTTKDFVPYWNQLLAYPVFFPVREDVVCNEAWATDPSTFISNGPYKMTKWNHNSCITLSKRNEFVDADKVKMNTIKFFLSDDSNNMLANFVSGSWLLIDEVPTEEIPVIKKNFPLEYRVEGQIGTYYVSWNINKNILPKDSKLTGSEAQKAQAEIRQALGLLFDRNYIVEEIVQSSQVPASSFVSMGMTNADGSEFYKTAGKAGNPYYGYYNVDKSAFDSNFASAVEALKKYYNWDGKKFTNFPALTFLYNTSSSHQAIAEYLQSAMASVGISMQLVNQEWSTFLNTREGGDYTIARNGWTADYNDPICFLDLWISSSGNNSVGYGKKEHKNCAIYNLDLSDCGYDIVVKNGTWAETYDILISTIKSCSDHGIRTKLMHKAEDILMSTGCIVPLYYYTDNFLIDDSVSGYFSNPLGFKYFSECTINKP